MSSLSSKLRELRKTLKKSKTNPTLKDEDICAVARNMPRDLECLVKYLSSEQVDAFGGEVLSITQAHTSRDQAKFEECILEMGAFVRGGLPGMHLLNSVYQRIMKHYGVWIDMEEVFEALKLSMNIAQNKIKRKWVKDEEDDIPTTDFSPPSSQKRMKTHH
jgi:ribonuclease D